MGPTTASIPPRTSPSDPWPPMYSLGRKLLFQVDAETAHQATMRALHVALRGPVEAALRRSFSVRDARLEVDAFGIRFPNPVGLAAGFDKNAEHVEQLFAFGFGHIEIGTVTGHAQPGNPRPRLFRLPQDYAILNRMGFNNDGAEAVARRLDTHRPPGILGINIGKTKAISNEEAPSDYERSFRLLFDFADYFVVNVSSPNTPGLRDLQDREPLLRLLAHLQELNQQLGDKPILLKIAPDLEPSAVEDVVDVASQTQLAGFVATNTTISRDGLHADTSELGAGGISGRPVAAKSRRIIGALRSLTTLPIVGVGGIFTHDDALETLAAGANLVQVWSGFVYQGPGVVRDINRGLLAQGFGA
ncbi:MAG: quinone-dependent dihydroorotate dehydrogenase [bacterium]